LASASTRTSAHRARRAGAAGRLRSEPERDTQRQRARQVAAVARVLERRDQGRVDEAVGCARGVDRRLHEARHRRRHRDGAARVGVQPRELAAGREAREAPVPGQERGLGVGGGALGARAADRDGALRAEAREATHGLDQGGHDWLVVIGVAVVLVDELLLVVLLLPVELDDEATRLAVVVVFAADGCWA